MLFDPGDNRVIADADSEEECLRFLVFTQASDSSCYVCIDESPHGFCYTSDRFPNAHR